MPWNTPAGRLRRQPFSLLRDNQAALAAVVAALLLWLAFHQGGYFPVTWNVSAVVLLGLVVVVVLRRIEVRLGRFDALLLSSLAALLAWTLLSASWSIAPAESILESQRTLLYLAGAAAVLVMSSRRGARTIAITVLVALTVICAHALVERLIQVDPLPYNRLGGSVEYWNALGMLAAAGACLAVALATHERSALARAAAGCSLPILICALYLTFSRGSFVALVIGLAVCAGMDPRRRELAVVGGSLALPCLVIVGLGATAHALTTPAAPSAPTAADAHRLAIAVVLACAGCAALATVAPRWAARLPAVSVRGVTVVTAVCGVVIAVAAVRGPARVLGATTSAFNAAPPSATSDQNTHLVSLSGSWRGEMWHVALTTFSRRPLAGNGAGTYGRLWLINRKDAITVQDAHSLYLETLSELGMVGLAVLLIVLLVPLLAARRALTMPYIPVLTATYVAFLVHAAIDWDWEMPVVTMTAFVCGSAIVAAARRERSALRRGVRTGGVAVAAMLGACGLVLLIGNRDLSAAAAAAATGQNDLAARARAAERWVPWSPDPPRWLAALQLSTGDRPAARRLLTSAIARDRTDWSLWLEIAAASDGAARTRAIREAVRLNPKGTADLFETAVRYGLVPAVRAQSRTQTSSRSRR